MGFSEGDTPTGVRMLAGYRLVAPLASTVLATTYRAVTPDSSRQVVLKVLRSYFSQEPGLLVDFRQELARCASLQHPYILTCEAWGEDGGRFWMAMPFAEGGNLTQRLNRRMRPQEALEIIEPLGESLDYAHSLGIVHGNVKPSNVLFSSVLFSSNGHPMLADFGMLTLTDGVHPLMRMSLLTPHPEYAAPELNRGGDFDGRADIYSLGVLLYQLLTSHVPFAGQNPYAVAKLQSEGAATPPSHFNPTLHRALDEVMGRALAHEPAARYPTAGALITDFKAALGRKQRLMPKIPVAEPAPIALPRPQAPGEWIICSVCGTANPVGNQFCDLCWIPLRKAVALSAEEKDIFVKERDKARRRQRIMRWTVSLVTALVLASGVGFWAWVSSRPLPPPTSNITVAPASGEWAMFRRDERHTAYQEAMTANPVGKVRWTFVTDAPMYSSPAVADGVVYLLTGDRRVVALEVATGRPLWEAPTTGPQNSAPAVADGVLYFGLRDGRVRALSTKDGQSLWGFQTGGPIYASPVVWKGVVYVGSADRHFYALDAKTGALRWKFRAGDWIESSAVIVGDLVAFGSRDRSIYFLDAYSGAKRLEIKTAGMVTSSPAAWGSIVFFGSDDAALRAVDSRKRNYPGEWVVRRIWTQLYIWYMAPKISPQTGFLWGTLYQGPILSSPAVDGKRVYFGSWDKKIHAVDMETGKKHWEYATKDIVISSPAVAGGRVYVGSRDGHLYALNADTGQLVWQFTTKDWITASPTVAEGMVFIASQDGTLYALE